MSLDLFVSSGGQLALQLLVLAVPFIFTLPICLQNCQKCQGWARSGTNQNH